MDTDTITRLTQDAYSASELDDAIGDWEAFLAEKYGTHGSLADHLIFITAGRIVQENTGTDLDFRAIETEYAYLSHFLNDLITTTDYARNPF